MDIKRGKSEAYKMIKGKGTLKGIVGSQKGRFFICKGEKGEVAWVIFLCTGDQHYIP
jgi:hypothetical protein